MDYKIELITIPVSDVDRAKAFYVDGCGFNADEDHVVHEGLRFVQLTPPGSACSICIGQGLTDAAPGSACSICIGEGLTDAEPGSVQGMQMVVADAQAAHDELAARGVPVSDVDSQPWGEFVYFSDPDGNAWALQQLPARA